MCSKPCLCLERGEALIFSFFCRLIFCHCLFICLDDKEIGYIWQICQLIKKKNDSFVLAGQTGLSPH